MKSLYTVQLNRSDLMELEGHLSAALQSFLSFTSHSLYFPTAKATPKEPQWISRERSLLLPLWFKEKPFGVFMARGADARTVKRLLPSLAALTHLCMEQLLCIKQSRTDELTGLARMPILLERMEQDVDMVRSHITGGLSTDQEIPLHKACMAIIVLRCPAMDSLASEFGYTFAHQALSTWAKALQQNLPQEVLATRSGENECALLLPTASRASCSKFTEELMARVDAVTLTHAPSKRNIRLRSVAGFALYPQDMENAPVALHMGEQAHRILHKARYAAHMAYERSLYLSKEEKNSAQSRYLAYARVLAHGGIIQDELPLGQLVTNLGRYGGAKEGQYYTVWGYREQTWQRKGEVVLMEVRNTHSIAEVLQQYDPTWAWEKGDNLRICTPKAPLALSDEAPISTKDVVSTRQTHDLLSHGDFLRKLTYSYENQPAFSLALIRILTAHGTHGAQETAQEQNTIEKFLHVYEEWKQSKFQASAMPFEGQSPTEPIFIGQYGETSLICYHTSTTAQKIEQDYTSLSQKAHDAGIQIAVGIASYPCLNAHKGEILEQCHKALDLALLLPAPHVGTMGSLAFNISADQRYSRGDVFGAVEEYKNAILADSQNAMAWNSLGVCMAALSRHSEARGHFKEALKLWKKNAKAYETKETKSASVKTELDKIHMEIAATLYNLGTVCQSLGETRSATRHFKECIQEDSTHYFAHIRLGQLAEQAQKYGQAKQYYTLSASLEKKGGQTGTAHRHLARIALLQEKTAEAREFLQETLLHNPQDAVALCMLAKIYLEGGEDPAMAEILARKSVGLRPEYAAAWRILGQSLRALGQEDDALNAEDKAAAL